jgi:hypothetical protein
MASVQETLDFFRDAVSHGVGDTLQYPIGNHLTNMVRNYELEYDTTGAVTCAMLISLSRITGAQVTMQEDQPEFPSVLANDRAGNEILTNDHTIITQADRKSFIQQFYQAQSASKAWLRDLTACQQVGPLSVDNINNYFLSQNGTRIHGGSILKIVNVAKNIFPRLIELEEIRDSLSPTPFLIYHCTYSSTPGLVRRFIDDTTGFVRISEETLDKVSEAYSKYWDMEASNEIGYRIIAMARAYLESVNALPANWYQGNKARQAVSPMLYNRWLNTFRVYSRIIQNLGDTDTIANLEMLANRTGEANLTA